MSESLTGEAQVQTASTEPTVQAPVATPSAESANQETNPGANTQGSVSDDTANQNQQTTGTQTQTQTTGGESQTDDGLVKFAKSQGIEDVSQLSEREARFLKMAHDNQKAARNKPKESISDAVSGLGSDNESLEAKVARLEYERESERFFSQPGRDKNLESVMVQIINEKKEQFGKEYAFQLAQDKEGLYELAAARSGSIQAQVDPDQIRREERESMNKKIAAGAPQAHATQSTPTQPVVIDLNWINNVYDSRNPEHRALVDAYYQNR